MVLLHRTLFMYEFYRNCTYHSISLQSKSTILYCYNILVKDFSVTSSFFQHLYTEPSPRPSSVISHSYNFEYTPYHKAQFFGDAALGRLAVFNRKGGVTGASSLADHSAFIYKRHSCRLLTWFVIFPEAFLAFVSRFRAPFRKRLT